MATRYSGLVVVRCTLDDRMFYRCSVSSPGYASWSGIVAPPASGYGPGIAYDSPEAYDQVARAALSFADHDKGGFSDIAAYDDALGSWHVGRSPATAWVSKENPGGETLFAILGVAAVAAVAYFALRPSTASTAMTSVTLGPGTQSVTVTPGGTVAFVLPTGASWTGSGVTSTTTGSTLGLVNMASPTSGSAPATAQAPSSPFGTIQAAATWTDASGNAQSSIINVTSSV